MKKRSKSLSLVLLILLLVFAILYINFGMAKDNNIDDSNNEEEKDSNTIISLLDNTNKTQSEIPEGEMVNEIITYNDSDNIYAIVNYEAIDGEEVYDENTEDEGVDNNDSDDTEVSENPEDEQPQIENIVNISSVEEFLNIGNTEIYNTNTVFSITNDIDFGYDNINPITFSGKRIEGNGHTLKNIRIEENGRYVGIFSKTFGGQIIQNLNVKNAEIIWSENEGDDSKEPKLVSIGGLVGEMQGGQVVNCNVTYSSIEYNNSKTAYFYVGGIIGCIKTVGNPVVKNCESVSNHISGKNKASIGGIIGQIYNSKRVDISECINSSKISISTGVATAGIIGAVVQQSVVDGEEVIPEVYISNCENHGRIYGGHGSGILAFISSADGVCYENSKLNIVNCENRALIYGEAGILGYCSIGGDINIDACYNSGKICSSVNGTASGVVNTILGFKTATILNCKNSGSINSRIFNSASGILGQASSGVENSVLTINDCVNELSSQISGGNHTSGIASDVSNISELNIKNCKNRGFITGSSCISGIVASANSIKSINMVFITENTLSPIVLLINLNSPLTRYLFR